MKAKQTFVEKVLAVLFIMLLIQAASFAQEKLPITTSSEEARELFMEGRYLYEIAEIEKSVPLFKKAIELDPDFALAYLYLMTERTGGKMAKQNQQKALKLAEKVSEGEKHQILSSIANIRGDEEKRKTHMEALLKMYPDNENVNYWMGINHYNNVEYEKAKNYATKAIELNNNYPPAFNLLGHTEMNLGNMEEADKAFKTFIKLLPEYASPRNSYAALLLKQGRFDESIKYYHKALKINPKYHFSYKGIGDSYLFKGDNILAREYYRKFGEYAPSENFRFNSFLLEASVDLHENKPENALELMDKYINRVAELKLPLYIIYGTAYKGYILTETGQKEKGLEYYRKAQQMIEKEEMDIGMRENLTTLGQLWIMYASVQADKIKEAEKSSQKCLERLEKKGSNSHWQFYYLCCGITELKKDNPQNAITHFKKAMDSPMKWYNIGIAYEKNGNIEEAKKWYQKVVNHYHNSIVLSTVRNKSLAKLKE